MFERRFQIGLALPRRGAFRRDIAIVESEVGNAQLGEEIERHVSLQPSRGERITRLKPGKKERAVVAEGIKAVQTESVPITHGKAQIVFHALAKDGPVQLG